MTYRTVKIAWLPRNRTQWATFTAARKEAARLWADLVERHYRIRRLHWHWPSKLRWEKWAKRKYPNLHSQSVQQIIGEFCEAVNATRQLRKNGHPEARYPWRKSRYRGVVYTNQGARIRDGRLYLPNGEAGTLRVRIPNTLALPGRLMEARLSYGCLYLVCECADAEHPQPHPAGPTIGVDLGVNTLIAATDGTKAVLVSGREAKATVQWRNKKQASIESRLSRLTPGSRQWKKLQRRKHKMLDKATNRISDIVHKATRKVADVFPHAKAYVGEPFNDAAQKMGRKQAQQVALSFALRNSTGHLRAVEPAPQAQARQVSSACNARMIRLLDYKLSGAIQVNEAYSSQTCPVCGERSKHARVYRCRCGFVAPRDIVGATNIRSIGMTGSLQVGCSVPNAVQFMHPVKYPGCGAGRHLNCPGSSGGHPASSCRKTEAAQL